MGFLFGAPKQQTLSQPVEPDPNKVAFDARQRLLSNATKTVRTSPQGLLSKTVQQSGKKLLGQ